MATHSPRVASSAVCGASLLTLQGLTAPLALVALARPTGATPRWLTGIYIALEFGAMVSATLVLLGIATKRPAARFAPSALLLPYWIAVACAGPFVVGGLPAVLFGGFALSAGVLTSLPLARAGRPLFEHRSERASSVESGATIGS